MRNVITQFNYIIGPLHKNDSFNIELGSNENQVSRRQYRSSSETQKDVVGPKVPLFLWQGSWSAVLTLGRMLDIA